MAKALDNFTITRSRDGYVLQIEDEDGETQEFTASYDQIELIAEEIDRHLDPDAEGDLDEDPAEDDRDEDDLEDRDDD